MDQQPKGRETGSWRRRGAVWAVPGAALLVALTVIALPKPAEHTATVEMRGNQYSPAQVTVNAGETVVWVNRDQVPHNVTRQGAWDSGVIAAGGRWTTTVSRSGTYAYRCSLHPGMNGTLVVR